MEEVVFEEIDIFGKTALERLLKKNESDGDDNDTLKKKDIKDIANTFSVYFFIFNMSSGNWANKSDWWSLVLVTQILLLQWGSWIFVHMRGIFEYIPFVFEAKLYLCQLFLRIWSGKKRKERKENKRKEKKGQNGILMMGDWKKGQKEGPKVVKFKKRKQVACG